MAMMSGKLRECLVLAAVTASLGVSGSAFGADGAAGGSMTVIFTIFDVLVVTILIAASISGVALAIDAILHIREKRIAPAETIEHLRSLINAKQFKELMEFTATDQSYVSTALNAGLRRAHLGYPAMREAMESSAGEQTGNLFRRIELLNVIGNMGPLLGLLGTVLGMIIAFYSMRDASGAAKPADLAGGIARALWHTFFGLLVAIPSLVTYGFYRTKIDKITTKAALVTEELLESLRPGEAGKNTGNASDDSRAPTAKPVPRRVPTPAPVENA